MLPLLYHSLLGKGRLAPRDAEAALDAPASDHRAHKASGWGQNQAAPAVQKIIVPTTKRCWEDKSVNVRESFETGRLLKSGFGSLLFFLLCSLQCSVRSVAQWCAGIKV